MLHSDARPDPPLVGQLSDTVRKKYHNGWEQSIKHIEVRATGTSWYQLRLQQTKRWIVAHCLLARH